MKTKIELGIRILLGLMLLVFGLNKFFQFMPMPPLPEQAGAFMVALAATGYFFPMLAIMEIAIGVLLLINKAKPLVLVMLTPITVNIVLFHLALDIEGIGGAGLVAIMHLTLVIMNKEKLMFLIKNDK